VNIVVVDYDNVDTGSEDDDNKDTIDNTDDNNDDDDRYDICIHTLPKLSTIDK